MENSRLLPVSGPLTVCDENATKESTVRGQLIVHSLWEKWLGLGSSLWSW